MGPTACLHAVEKRNRIQNDNDVGKSQFTEKKRNVKFM
jgi:hypothetical protein